jgi:Rrf2 family protein
MIISQKCQYALWAIFELAWRNSTQPAKIQNIAEAQGIPARFLEVILSDLKTGGFVESRRGKSGGYLLARDPKDLKVAEIITHVQGPVDIVNHSDNGSSRNGQFRGDLAFGDLWERARVSVSKIYEGMTFAQLIDDEKSRASEYIPDYAI